MYWGAGHKEILLVLGLLLIIAIISIALLYKRSSGSTRIRRILLFVLGLIGLGLIVLQPSIDKKITPKTAHILTPPSKTDQQNEKATYHSVHDFLNSDIADKTGTVVIDGLGLSEDELGLLKNYTLEFQPADTITGITAISIPKVTERERWTLRGEVQGTSQGADIESIALIGPDGQTTEASVSGTSFTIQSVAPAAGTYLYDIVVQTQQDSIAEQLSIEVAHEPSWSMLVLSSFPSFEMNYLKNYWTSLGNSFTLRSQISTNKYSTSFANTPKQDLQVLTRKTIQSYDFVIADRASWNQLSSQERSNILRAVSDDGLALIFRAEQSDIQATGITLPTLSTPREITWKTSADDVALLQYPASSTWSSARLQGHVLSSYRSGGLGHIAALSIDDTYKLILADQPKAYQSLWSTVFSKLYRDFSPSAQLRNNDWIWAEEPTTITILTDQTLTTPPLLNDTIPLYFVEAPFLAGVLEAEVQPLAGYNKIKINGSDELSFYAHEQDAWAAVRQHHLAKINSMASDGTRNVAAPATHTTRQEISLYWWYAITLFGFGGLWLHEQLYS